MYDFTLVILGSVFNFEKEIPIDIIYYENSLKDTLKKVKTKYVVFVKSSDYLGDNYFKSVIKKTQGEFDCCFINYKCNYLNYDKKKIPSEYREIKGTKPTYGSYIWNFIFKTDKLLETIAYKYKDIKDFNEFVEKTFFITECINEIVYYHKPNSQRVMKEDIAYVDRKSYTHLKNVIYVGVGCSGTFNGYVSWVRNIGKIFGNKYEITLLYDEVGDKLHDEFVKTMECVKLDPKVNYLCERLLVTYSTYFYPRNIICLDKNYMFIHGNSSDYKNTKRYRDDVYSEYIAVSKVAAEKAVGYYPTEDIKYVYNPYIVDEERVRPHLRLVSAMRSSDIKRPERIKQLAEIFDELDIPYTWDFFTDKNENTNSNGLIYRRRVVNPLPYVNDCDYFVLLSDSEALPYCIVEALSLNTKVVVTPLEACEELGVKDGVNGIIIPFDYFEEKNKHKLVEIAKRIYAEKDKQYKYEYSPSRYEKYNEFFIK